MKASKPQTWFTALLFFLPMIGAGVFCAALALEKPAPVKLVRKVDGDGRKVEVHRAQYGLATIGADGTLMTERKESIRWPVLTLAVRNFDRWIIDAAYAEHKAMGTMFSLAELQEWDGGLNRGTEEYATLIAEGREKQVRADELKKLALTKDAEAALSPEEKKAREEKLAAVEKLAAEARAAELDKQSGRLAGYYPVVRARYNAWNYAMRAQARLMIAGRIFESLAPFDASSPTKHDSSSDSFNLFVFKVQPGETEHAAWGDLVRMVDDQCRAPISIALKIADNWLRLPTQVNADGSSAFAKADGAAPAAAVGESQSFTLWLRPRVMQTLAIGAALQVFVLVLVLAHYTTVLRDPAHPRLARDKRAPWSLSRVTLAWWLMLCTASYLYVWAMTDNVNNLSGSAVVLLGINGATLLSSSLMRKRQPAPDAGAELSPDPGPQESAGLLWDLICETGEPEASRMQMLVWNGVLGVVFAWQTVATWTMPTFDATLMTLLGISSTAYVGFKFATK